MSLNPIHKAGPGTRFGFPKPAAGLSPGMAQARVEAAFSRHASWPWVSLSVLIIWMMVGAYYTMVPPRYVTKWSMIMPTTTSGTTVQLDTIGQSATLPGQPFGNVMISPKVIYKEIAGSDQVRKAAAELLGITAQELGKPRTKLIDETSLLLFEIVGKTPEEAQAKGRALMSAFEQRLDALRRDEFERRAGIVRDNLKLYKANLDVAREAIVEFQERTGLLSTEQYRESMYTAEKIRNKLVATRADLEQIEQEQERLVARVGLTPAQAAVALKLAAEPTFARITEQYSEAHAEYRSGDRLYGPNHPARRAAAAKREAVLHELKRLAGELNLDPTVELVRLATMLNMSHQSELLREIVSGEAKLVGHRKSVQLLERQLVAAQEKAVRLGGEAARLEYLNKDVIAAQAVYTTAVARLDTDRSDAFSSYPMVQLLAGPELPGERSQPKLSYALIAGVGGTILVLLAWGVAWARSRFSRIRRKST